jgi:xylan 1,4-beta-xylosidase
MRLHTAEAAEIPSRFRGAGTIHNPVLPGFNPDPSIIRVGDDYYLATSTFEWFPGVAVYRSRDLVHWRAIGHLLTKVSQLDLRGVPDSGGAWAPSLSYDLRVFYLTYSIMRTKSGALKDVHNYLGLSRWHRLDPRRSRTGCIENR